MGLLRRGATERAMAAGHGRDTLIGQRLVESKLASPPIVAAVLRRQSRERIEALFSLSDADIRFRVARPMHAARIKPLPLLASDFLHGRPRKRDPEMSAKVTRCARRAQLRELLGVSAHADPVALRRAFRTRAAALHPDRYPHASDAERAQLGERFAELSAAYHGLNENG
jgi:DnaJ-domain-containing protein 1